MFSLYYILYTQIEIKLIIWIRVEFRFTLYFIQKFHWTHHLVHAYSICQWPFVWMPVNANSSPFVTFQSVFLQKSQRKSEKRLSQNNCTALSEYFPQKLQNFQHRWTKITFDLFLYLADRKHTAKRPYIKRRKSMSVFSISMILNCQSKQRRHSIEQLNWHMCNSATCR